MTQTVSRRRRGGNPAIPPGDELANHVHQTGGDPAEATSQKWPVLTEYEIGECKKAARGMPVYQYNNPAAPEQTFVYRPLRSREWQALSTMASPQDSEFAQDERVARAAIIWPPDIGNNDYFWANTLAGHAASLALQVQRHSGFPLMRPDGAVVESAALVTLLSNAEEDEADLELPSVDQIEEWRKTVPNGHIYSVEFPNLNKIFFLRGLMRAEYYAIQGKSTAPIDTATMGCKSATLWPTDVDWDNEPAGVIDHVFETVLEASAFNAKPTVQQL